MLNSAIVIDRCSSYSSGAQPRPWTIVDLLRDNGRFEAVNLTKGIVGGTHRASYAAKTRIGLVKLRDS